MHKDRKETTHVEVGERNIHHIYKKDKYNVCQKWSQDPCTKTNVSKVEKRKRYM